MSDNEFRSVMFDVAYLAGCAVNRQKPDAQRIAGLNPEHLLEAARKHKLGAAVGMALESAGIRDPQFVREAAMAQRRIALLDIDRKAVLDRLEEAGIWYAPLKGAILKDLYPRFGMREMADNDILFDETRAEDVRRIMVDLGFSVEEFDERNHDVYYKKPVTNMEMHRSLFHKEHQDLCAYYANVKNRLIPDESRAFGRHFSDEDFYLYMIAHEYSHYRFGGTGLRSLLDTYVFLKNKRLDMAYIAREAEKIGISDFERKNRALALHLFDGAELTREEKEMLDYIFFSGTYGTKENRINNEVAQKGKLAYFLCRLFPSVDYLSKLYPFLKKAPFLYPLCWVMRNLRGVFCRRREMKAQMKAALGMSKKKDE